MLIAHLPAGYLFGRAAEATPLESRWTMQAALTGAMFPDLDMLWFHLVDGGAVHHHDYMTHWPILYIGVCVAGFLAWRSGVRAALPCLVFGLSAMIHMVLDSIAAPVMWLAPFSDWRAEMVTVPATHAHWILSFTTHWTFMVELSICGMAAILLMRERRKALS